MADKLEQYTILGRDIGYANGWDQGDTFAMSLYQLQPAPGVDKHIPPGVDVFIDFPTGVVEWYSRDNEKPLGKMDLMELLKDATKADVE